MVVQIHGVPLRNFLLLFIVSAMDPMMSAGAVVRYPNAAASLEAGHWVEAQAQAKETIRRAARAGDTVTLYQSYAHLGQACRMLNQPAAALTAYQKAFQGAELVNDKTHQSPYAYHIGALRLQLEGPAAALPDLRRAQALAQAIKDHYYEAWADLRIGEAYDRLGDYERADTYYRQAFALHQRLGDAEGVCYDYKNLGDYQLMTGDYEQAADLYRQGLDLAQRARVANRESLEAMIWADLGLVALRQGEYETARRYYEKARPLAEKSHDPALWQTVLGQLGTIELRIGDTEAARSSLESARQRAAAMGLRAGEGFWWARLGEVYLKRGQTQEAEALYRRARDRGQQLQYSQLIEEATAGLGAVKEVEKDFEAALSLYEQAIALIEKERQRLVLEKEKSGYFVDKLAIYERLVRLLVRLHHRDPSRDYGRQAFEYVERAKAQAFLQKVPQGVILKYLKEKSEAYQQWEAEYQKTRDQLYGQLAAARRELERMPDSGGDERLKKEKRSQIAERERELAEQEKGHVQFIAHQVRRLFPQLMKLYEPEILSVERIQTLLKPQEVLLEYHVQAEKTFAFVIAPTGLAVVDLPFGRAEREDLMSVIEGVRWASTGKEKNYLRGEAVLTGLERYYRKLFAPVEKFIPAGAALIMVPDDWLHYLSFGMLVTARPGGRAQYLIERYPVSYTDSASLLNPALWAKPKTRAAPPLDGLLLGNPDRHGPGAEGLGDLPFAEAEVEAIRPYFKRVRVLKGRAATEGAFKAHAGKARVVHVAGHHLLDAANPWRSRLVLALDPTVNRDGNDGLVYTYELFALDLDTELLVLSACDSGSGTVRIGEGLEGPTRAALYAGAQSVLATLWWVSDQATGALMSRFYDYLAQGLDKRQALQRAQVDLIRAGYAHPHYWAGFRLSGDTNAMQTPMQRSTAWSRRSVMVLLGIVVFFIIAMRAQRITRKAKRL